MRLGKNLSLVLLERRVIPKTQEAGDFEKGGRVLRMRNPFYVRKICFGIAFTLKLRIESLIETFDTRANPWNRLQILEIPQDVNADHVSTMDVVVLGKGGLTGRLLMRPPSGESDIQLD